MKKRKVFKTLTCLLSTAFVLGICALSARKAYAASINDTNVEVEGIRYEQKTSGNSKYWEVVGFDKEHMHDLLIPNALEFRSDTNSFVPSDNTVISASGDRYPIASIKNDVFDDMYDVNVLKLPKILGGTYKSSDWAKLRHLKEFRSDAEVGNRFYVNEGVLYKNNELIKYPELKYGSYNIPNGTTGSASGAFILAKIDTLTIPDTFNIKHEEEEIDGKKIFNNTFFGSLIGKFKGKQSFEGSLFDGDKLIYAGKYITEAAANHAKSVSPYAFINDGVYYQFKNLRKNNELLKNIPFNFYSGERLTNNFTTIKFLINGEMAYCYNYGKLNPLMVTDKLEYNEQTSGTTIEQLKNIKKALFIGYPNDGYKLLKKYDIFGDEARSITAKTIWFYLNQLPEKELTADNIYVGARKFDISLYLEDFKKKMNEMPDSDIENFKLGFYPALDDEHQGLVVIEKESKPKEVRKIELSILKKDASTGEALEGAKLELMKKDTKEVVEKWISGKDSQKISSDKITNGVYILREIESPEGYLKAEDIEVTIKPDVNTYEVVMLDKPVIPTPKEDKPKATPSTPSVPATPNEPKKVEPYYDILISKQDVSTKKEIAGARLVIKDVNGNILHEWVSVENESKKVTLKDGTYTLIETLSPNGYSVAEKITFKVENGKVAGDKVVMYDEPIKKPKTPIGGSSDGGRTTPPPSDPNRGPGIPPQPKQPDNPPVTKLENKPEVKQEPKPEPKTENKERKPVKTGDALFNFLLGNGIIMLGSLGYGLKKREE